MKALSVCQPWAWAIFHGKDVENRSWSTNHRGPLLIHASKTNTYVVSEYGECRDDWPGRYKIDLPDKADLVFGAVIGVVDVVDVVNGFNSKRRPSVWADTDMFWWKLNNPRPFTELIPFTGKVGLFNVEDQEVLKQAKRLVG
jgi:hypothetical protein